MVEAAKFRVAYSAVIMNEHPGLDWYWVASGVRVLGISSVAQKAVEC